MIVTVSTTAEREYDMATWLQTRTRTLAQDVQALPHSGKSSQDLCQCPNISGKTAGFAIADEIRCTVEGVAEAPFSRRRCVGRRRCC